MANNNELFYPLVNRIKYLEKSLKEFDAEEVVTLFMQSEYFSANLSPNKLIERCLSWYANEMVNIDELSMIRTRKMLADKKF